MLTQGKPGLQARATAAGGEVTAAMLSGLGADFQPGVGAIADFSFNLNCGAPEATPRIAPWSRGALLNGSHKETGCLW